MASDSTETLPSEKSHRSRRGGVLLSFGIVALLVLAAAGYFFSARDAGKDTSPAPKSQQAARPGGEDVASRPVDNAGQPSASLHPTAPVSSAVPATEASSAPPVAPALSSGTSSPQPTSQDSAAPTQAPTDSVPVQSAIRPTPAPPSSMRDQPTSLPNDEIAFVQKQGVNIRSEPSVAGRIVGSASKGRQFKVTRRVGNWAQVEGDFGTGWISGRLLGPEKP